MSHRVERVFNRRLPRGRDTVTVPVPAGHRRVQVVIDRTGFEDITVLTENVFKVSISSRAPGPPNSHYCGGATFIGGRIDTDVSSLRLGTRMLWSVLIVHLPVDASTMAVEVDAIIDFDCLLHVDFID